MINDVKERRKKERRGTSEDEDGVKAFPPKGRV
jgi:hypothetical protein